METRKNARCLFTLCLNTVNFALGRPRIRIITEAIDGTVIASEPPDAAAAIHSSNRGLGLDCFAALAMTAARLSMNGALTLIKKTLGQTGPRDMEL
jgi:hypothetical protein